MEAEQYYKQGDIIFNKIVSQIGVSKMTLYKYVRYGKVEIVSYIYQSEHKKSNT